MDVKGQEHNLRAGFNPEAVIKETQTFEIVKFNKTYKLLVFKYVINVLGPIVEGVHHYYLLRPDVVCEDREFSRHNLRNGLPVHFVYLVVI